MKYNAVKDWWSPKKGDSVIVPCVVKKFHVAITRVSKRSKTATVVYDLPGLHRPLRVRVPWTDLVLHEVAP